MSRSPTGSAAWPTAARCCRGSGPMFRRATGTEPQGWQGLTDPTTCPGRSSAAILAGMHLGFLGFGLIAGSVARAVRANAAAADWTMAAWSPTGTGPASALAEGIIDRAAHAPESTLDGAEIVVLGAPATACLELIDRLAGPWRDRLTGTAVVTDVASTKARLVERADAVGLRFVGGHPMAGLERTGFGASDARLFRDRPWIIVPGALASPADMARVEALARACSARAIVMDAGAHDRAVAGIGRLPLVASVALVEAVTGVAAADPGAGRAADWPIAAGLAAGGWRDMTRLARGDPAMGAAIVATNAEALAARVRDLRAALDGWLAELERVGGPDEAYRGRGVVRDVSAEG